LPGKDVENLPNEGDLGVLGKFKFTTCTRFCRPENCRLRLFNSFPISSAQIKQRSTSMPFLFFRFIELAIDLAYHLYHLTEVGPVTARVM